MGIVFIDAVVFVVVVAFVLVAITQVIEPLVRGTMLFPFFRTRESTLRERARALQALKETRERRK